MRFLKFLDSQPFSFLAFVGIGYYILWKRTTPQCAEALYSLLVIELHYLPYWPFVFFVLHCLTKASIISYRLDLIKTEENDISELPSGFRNIDILRIVGCIGMLVSLIKIFCIILRRNHKYLLQNTKSCIQIL